MTEDGYSAEDFNDNWPVELRYWTERRAENVMCRRLTEFLGEKVTPEFLDDMDEIMLGTIIAWMDMEQKAVSNGSS